MRSSVCTFLERLVEINASIFSPCGQVLCKSGSCAWPQQRCPSASSAVVDAHSEKLSKIQRDQELTQRGCFHSCEMMHSFSLVTMTCSSETRPSTYIHRQHIITHIHTTLAYPKKKARVSPWSPPDFQNFQNHYCTLTCFCLELLLQYLCIHTRVILIFFILSF